MKSRATTNPESPNVTPRTPLFDEKAGLLSFRGDFTEQEILSGFNQYKSKATAIKFEGCSNLQSLPIYIAHSSKIKSITIDNCPKFKQLLSDDAKPKRFLGCFPSFTSKILIDKDITLSNLSLTAIPGNIYKGCTLNINNCNTIEEIANLKLPGGNLEIISCAGLKSITGLDVGGKGEDTEDDSAYGASSTRRMVNYKGNITIKECPLIDGAGLNDLNQKLESAKSKGISVTFIKSAKINIIPPQELNDTPEDEVKLGELGPLRDVSSFKRGDSRRLNPVNPSKINSLSTSLSTHVEALRTSINNQNPGLQRNKVVFK